MKMETSSLPRILARTLRKIDAIEERRSVRSFKPEKLDKDTIAALLQAAVLAPTARHLEPWAFVVVQDRALLKRISNRAKAAWPPQTSAPQEKHAAAHVPATSHFAGLLDSEDFNIFYDAGTLIVICARPVGPFAVADCWLAAENLMLQATEMGLGTCCIGSAVEALNAPDIKAELGIPKNVDVVVPVIAGVPDFVPAPTGRQEPVILSWK